jgi:MFS family permease
VVLANAASYVLAFVLMLGVTGGRAVAGDDSGDRARGWWVAFADRGYRTLIAVIFCYAMTMMTLNISMPVYFVDSLGLPGWMPGTVFVINTVMIGLGQGLVVRRMTGHARRRVLQAAVAFTAAAFALFIAADGLGVTAGVALVLVAAMVYTLGELTGGPVVSALSAETPPPEQRGRYMAASQLAWSTSAAISPLLYSALLDRGSVAAWGGPLVICLVWLGLIEVLARRVPQVTRPVTNVAEPEPGPIGSGAVGSTAEAPASS